MDVSIPSSSGHQFTGRAAAPVLRLARPRFNPFFIRASVYCGASCTAPVCCGATFQSLLHQGISLLIRHRRDMPAGRHCGFQSLLHQGISLLKAPVAGRRPRRLGVSIPSSSGHQFTASGVGGLAGGAKSVSIPSSSGHQFTGRHCPSGRRRRRGFNPFFIRASVYWLSLRRHGLSCTATFQSLLHQGISLLQCRPVLDERSQYLGFNPFFIRASVY